MEWKRLDEVENVKKDEVKNKKKIEMVGEGKNVLCEKKMDERYEKEEEMEDEEKKEGVVNMVKIKYRNVEKLKKEREMVMEGEIGKVRKLEE